MTALYQIENLFAFITLLSNLTSLLL